MQFHLIGGTAFQECLYFLKFRSMCPPRKQSTSQCETIPAVELVMSSEDMANNTFEGEKNEGAAISPEADTIPS